MRTDCPKAPAAPPNWRWANPRLTIAEHPEEVRVHQLRPDELRAIRDLDAHLAALVVGDGLERFVLPADVNLVAAGHGGLRPPGVRPVVQDGDDAIGIGITQGLEDHS